MLQIKFDEIREHLKNSNYSKAELLLNSLLSSSMTRDFWKKLTGSNTMPNIFNHIKAIKFKDNIKTAEVNYKSKLMKINPQFFIDMILHPMDLLFIVYHERNHILLENMFEAYREQIKGRGGHKLLNKIEDMFINALTRKHIKSDLPERYYDDGKGKKKLIYMFTCMNDMIPDSYKPIKDLHYRLYNYYAPDLSDLYDGNESEFDLDYGDFANNFCSIFDQLEQKEKEKQEKALEKYEKQNEEANKEEEDEQESTESQHEGEDTNEDAEGDGGEDEGESEDDSEDGEETASSSEKQGESESEEESENDEDDLDESESEEETEDEEEEEETDVDGESESEDGDNIKDIDLLDDEESDSNDDSNEDEEDGDEESDSNEDEISDGESEESEESDDGAGGGTGAGDGIEDGDEDEEDEDDLDENLLHDMVDAINDTETMVEHGDEEENNEAAPEIGDYSKRELYKCTIPSQERVTLLNETVLGEERQQYVKPLKYDVDKLKSTILNVVSERAQDKTMNYSTLMMPSSISRKDMFNLSCGNTPVLWSSKLGVEEEDYVVFIDVSGSMSEYYGMIFNIADWFRDMVKQVVQFSNEIVNVDIDTDSFWTTGGTSFDAVIREINKQNYRNIIMITDNNDYIRDAKFEVELENFILILVENRDYFEGFKPYATQIVTVDAKNDGTL